MLDLIKTDCRLYCSNLNVHISYIKLARNSIKQVTYGSNFLSSHTKCDEKGISFLKQINVLSNCVTIVRVLASLELRLTCALECLTTVNQIQDKSF